MKKIVEDSKTIQPRSFARKCALQYIYQLDQQDDWAVRSYMLEEFWAQKKETNPKISKNKFKRIVEFAEELIYGTTGKVQEINETIESAASNWTLERMATVDRNIIRVATYEICFCDNIPGKATINEALELAKIYGHNNSGRFVNGVLDKIFNQIQKQ